MSQSMLIPGHHLCDVNSNCHKGGAGRGKGLGKSLERASKEPSMAEHLVIHSFITAMHLCGGTGLLSTRILQGEETKVWLPTHCIHLCHTLPKSESFPHFNLQRAKYAVSALTLPGWCPNSIWFDGRQNQSVDVFIEIYVYLVPQKNASTFAEYLAGVNSQGGSIGVDVEIHSDPSLHKSLGKDPFCENFWESQSRGRCRRDC